MSFLNKFIVVSESSPSLWSKCWCPFLCGDYLVRKKFSNFNQQNLCVAVIQGTKGKFRHFPVCKTTLRNSFSIPKGHSVFLIYCVIQVKVYIVIVMWLLMRHVQNQRWVSVLIFLPAAEYSKSCLDASLTRDEEWKKTLHLSVS